MVIVKMLYNKLKKKIAYLLINKNHYLHKAVQRAMNTQMIEFNAINQIIVYLKQNLVKVNAMKKILMMVIFVV